MSDFKNEYKSALESVQPSSEALKMLAEKMSEQAKLTASNPKKKNSFFYSNLPLKIAGIAACAVLVIGAAVMVPMIVSNSNSPEALLKTSATGMGAPDSAGDSASNDVILGNDFEAFADGAVVENAIEEDGMISSTAVAEATISETNASTEAAYTITHDSASKESGFIDSLQQTIDNAKTVSGLTADLLATERVSGVSIYKNSDNYRSGIAVSSGDMSAGMIIYVEYDDGKSWAEFYYSGPFKLNYDLLGEIGMSYNELVDKYGESSGTGYANTRSFSNSYGGRYFWDDKLVNATGSIENSGGLIGIAGVKPEDIFVGITFPMTFDELISAYEIKPKDIATEIGMSDLYSSSFVFNEIEIVINTKEMNVIDADSSCWVELLQG